MEPWSPALQADSLPVEPQGSPATTLTAHSKLVQCETEAVSAGLQTRATGEIDMPRLQREPGAPRSQGPWLRAVGSRAGLSSPAWGLNESSNSPGQTSTYPSVSTSAGLFKGGTSRHRTHCSGPPLPHPGD